MSPNGVSSGFNKVFILSSSDSSDSEFLVQEDIKSSGSQINQQWEAIERTLYQEPGPQVTDSELLKECKLWRETFPHFRVKGTKLDIKQTDDALEETDKKIQTLQNHFELKKVEEKRQNLKTKVVGMLVERLIAKYGPVKENTNTEGVVKSGLQITEIDDDCSENFLSPSKSVSRNSERAVCVHNESYFERGKLLNMLEDDDKQEAIREILDSWEEEPKTAKKLPKAYRNNDFIKLENPKYNFGVNCSDKPIKQKKFTPPSNPLGNLTRPFEMTKKIDKRYEGLVDRIIERKSNELETIRHCHTSASGFEMKNFEDSLDKLRIGSAFDEYTKRTAKMRISKFDNNWLKKSEVFCVEDNFPAKKTQNLKPTKKTNLYNEETQINEIDDKFIENLKREMALNYKRSPKKSGVIEEISLRKPKPFKPPAEKATKSLSCGEIRKKNKKETKGRQLKSGLEMGKTDSNLKKTVSHVSSKGSRPNASQNSLPPIESGIICTELTGRPKIGAKIPPKRY